MSDVPPSAALGVGADEYLAPDIPHGLPWREVPIVEPDDPRVGAVALITDQPETFEVPIVAWPTNGRRPLDPGTGTGGGTVQGTFGCTWDGAVLFGSNQAVDGRYVLGWSTAPESAGDAPPGRPDQVLLWHINYHPDGGQLFWSRAHQPFVVLAIPPGSDPDLDQAIAIRAPGDLGVCLLPNVWHDGVFPVDGDGTFVTRQGAVHARLSCNLATEHGLLLRIPLGQRDRGGRRSDDSVSARERRGEGVQAAGQAVDV